ncbi:unnamed protein product [Adineta steineri]|uniref:Caspase family p20 domain-containing protein n=1 Tax=Adineta steineri TaxID=433720 RepID=A0A819FDX0_9BILA|nr:unnamed protein product [Adineta steineri]CAF3866976.1 unnamed protein product [Adineta steineri]
MATSTSTVLRFQRKVALLIGNQNYCRSEDQLRHTINDVDDISIALRNMKFHVKIEHDLYNSEMICAFSDFSNIIIDGDLILFYFSGHGCEINGKNYLSPIDDELIENDKGIENCAINIECILHQWAKQYPSSIIIFILDCCRLPYPYKKKRINNVKCERNDSHPMELSVGTYVVFACSPYQIASDGLLTERNGLFAKHLLKHMTKPNKDIKQLFRTVTNGVCIESKQKQKPTRIDGLIGLEQIYLNDKSIHINNGNKKTKYKGSSVLQ